MNVIKKSLPLFLAIALTGCNATPPSASDKTGNFKYDPKGKIEFVFTELDAEKQKDGYPAFCFNKYAVSTCDHPYDRPKYSDYYGLKGYLIDSNSGSEVIFENGTKAYLTSKLSREIKDKERRFKIYGDNIYLKGEFGLTSIELYNEKKNFKQEPLFKGSSIKITDIEHGTFNDFLILSNGEKIKSDSLSNIREVARTLKYKKGIDEILTKITIGKDEFEENYFLKTSKEENESYLRFYIGLNEKQSWLRLKIKYHASNWLFVNKIKTLADGKRWESSQLDFKRDNEAGEIWEWIDIPVTKNDKIYTTIKNGLNSKNFTIRFVGDKYHDDLSVNNKKENKEIIKLFELINQP